tara:strand:+ start:1022 stop:1240 length:219 start_codon:yes stop_codon:yes gene_type:complete
MDWKYWNSLSESEIADNFTKDILVIVSDEQGTLEVYNDSNGYIEFNFDGSFDFDQMEAQKEFFKKLIKYLGA